jgi:uncharacterized protein
MASALQNDHQPVTTVITHLVKPGQESSYEKWIQDISAVARQFEGHCGVSIIRPQDFTNPEYVILLRFDCYDHLKQWMESDIRQRWIDKAKPLVQKDQNVQVLTGLETWFTLPSQPLKRPPARYKITILSAFAVYILSILLSYLLAPVLSRLPLLLRSFITSALIVTLLTYVVMPRVTRLFYKWLYPKTKPSI